MGYVVTGRRNTQAEPFTLAASEESLPAAFEQYRVWAERLRGLAVVELERPETAPSVMRWGIATQRIEVGNSNPKNVVTARASRIAEWDMAVKRAKRIADDHRADVSFKVWVFPDWENCTSSFTE